MIGSIQPHHTQEPLIFQLRRGQALQAQAIQSGNNEGLLGLFGAILYFLQSLDTAGHKIKDFTLEEPNLEDAFMKLTGEDEK